jgi:transcription antitermination factor NusG
MPTLASETSIFPDALLDDLAVTCDERKWWVIYTKARQEKALARNLLSQEIPFYLPLVEKTQYNRQRRSTSYLPVFPGYLFLFGTPNERVTSLTTNRISRILPVDDGERLLRDLSNVRQMIDAKLPLTIESRLTPGQKVRVKVGCLAGLEGTIIARRKKHHLLVAVQYLQQGVSVQIEDFMVEPI